MLNWKSPSTHPMPKSGFFLVAHDVGDGEWVYDVPWWEEPVNAWIIDLEYTELEMGPGSLWAPIPEPRIRH